MRRYRPHNLDFIDRGLAPVQDPQGATKALPLVVRGTSSLRNRKSVQRTRTQRGGCASPSRLALAPLTSITCTKVFRKVTCSCSDGDCAGASRPAKMLRAAALRRLNSICPPSPAASLFLSVFSFEEGAQRSSVHERSVFRGARYKFSVRSREESFALQSRAHRLRLRIQLERIFAHLAPPAGLFVAAEGKSGVENVVAVNPHGSRAQG